MSEHWTDTVRPEASAPRNVLERACEAVADAADAAFRAEGLDPERGRAIVVLLHLDTEPNHAMVASFRDGEEGLHLATLERAHTAARVSRRAGP